MSIASEITRIQGAKADLKTAIEGKGVTVPSSTKLDGYADLVDDIQTGGGGEPNLQDKSVSYTPTESQQTATVTADSGYDGLNEVSVTVGAISSSYVGTGITRRSSSDLTASGATVSVPSGYYENNASKAVASGTEGTPTATKGAVSNHAVSVTPSVTNTAGYISGDTKTGSAVSVSASELVSGTKSITQNGTEDVTNYASVNVAVPQPSGTKNITISANGTTTEDVTSYASASITANVPNTYSASDEGKVVDNGALVSQTSDTVTANDTYDTTLINSLTVNVSGSSGWSSDGVANGTEPSGAITLTVTTVIGHAFHNNTGITSITGNNVTSIGGGSLQACTNMTSASFPNVTQIGDDGFNGCTKLVSIDVRKLVKFSTKRGFSGCSKLTTFVGGLTKLKTISDQCFYNTRVPVFVLPAITSGTGSASCFGSNTALTTCDFGVGLSSVGASTFNGASSFNTLIIRKASVASLSNINAFTNTPFASGKEGGTLYVPNDLISSYQSASNWSTILGYANNQIKSIESTHTDQTAPIDLTLYYADGTLIPTT